ELAGELVAFTVIHVFSFTLARSLGRAQRVEYRLLDTLFPPRVADSLRRGEPVAQHFDGVSVLFADLVGFTGLAASLPPAEVVAILDALFQELDGLTRAHGAEKIKTIGDCYMVAAGVPEPRPDHAVLLVDLALAMQEAVAARRFAGRQLSLRIGIHSGPVVAGVVGRGRQLYDLWGDTVNVASRMESQGEAGAIQISPATAAALGDAFILRRRGAIEVKGWGELTTYFVEGRSAPAA
ncbi:MAG: adenylate/guanylate cyclase domain-containing protein, partial [Myxococcales bacterium]|nr:adenylate/guanylate cyclase domain-containing protein [Myxococcales bacterium]